MPTRNVVLTDRQAELIEDLVESGKYQNASEVLREGMRLIEAREAEEKARLEALRDAVRVGVADIEAGRYKTLKRPAVRKHLAALAEAALRPRGKAKRRK